MQLYDRLGDTIVAMLVGIVAAGELLLLASALPLLAGALLLGAPWWLAVPISAVVAAWGWSRALRLVIARRRALEERKHFTDPDEVEDFFARRNIRCGAPMSCHQPGRLWLSQDLTGKSVSTQGHVRNY